MEVSVQFHGLAALTPEKKPRYYYYYYYYI
jgi:hypothetical protein